MRRVFVSFHHKNDQKYKDYLVTWAKENAVFIDGSVDTGDIDDKLSDEEIRIKIRDEYLKDTTVTILLVGLETKYRKHIDWELYSSMYDGKKNKKSGIIVILLPSVQCDFYTVAHAGEKECIYSDVKNWTSISERTVYEERCPYLPERIIDNLLAKDARISVFRWKDLLDDVSDALSVKKVRYIVEKAFEDRDVCKYDLSRSMRRRNGY